MLKATWTSISMLMQKFKKCKNPIRLICIISYRVYLSRFEKKIMDENVWPSDVFVRWWKNKRTIAYSDDN